VAGAVPWTPLGELTALPRTTRIRVRGGREGEEMRQDEGEGGRRDGKERVREVKGEEDRRGQGKGGERKRKGTKKRKEERERKSVPPVHNSQFKHCAQVHVTSQRREQQ